MSTTATSAATPGVDRRAGLSKADFDREYLFPHRPVVVTDALRDWPALGKWTPEFFRERFADRLINVSGEQRPLGPFIDEVLASTPEKPAPYFRNELFYEVFPELSSDIEPQPPYMGPNWLNRRFRSEDAQILARCGATEIYIGGAGQSFPVMHYDWLHTHAFLMQIHGRKQYFVYPADQTPFVYPLANDPNRSQVNDVEQPDLAKFPLFSKAKGFSFTLDPGEMLFMPCGWWHTVRMLTPSITISVNIANASNWKQLREDFCAHTFRMKGSRKKALKMDLYLRVIGLISALPAVVADLVDWAV